MPGLGDLLTKPNPTDGERNLAAREVDRIDNAVSEYGRILGPRGSIQLLRNDVLELNTSGGILCEWVLETDHLTSEDGTLVLNGVVPFISLDMPDGIQTDESGIYFGRDPADGLGYLRGYGAGVVHTELRASDGKLYIDGVVASSALPLTLSVSTTNTSSPTGHTHAITASASPGAAAALLKTTAAGLLTLAAFTVSASGASVTVDSTSTSSSGLVFYSTQATQWNLITHIDFYGHDSGGNDTQYVSLRAYIGDPANGAEGGAWALEAMAAGTSRVLLKGYFAGTAGEVVVNEDSIDLDFRVETDANQYGLHVDASLGSVGIMQAGETGFVLAATGAVQIKGASSALLYIRETSTGNAAIYVYDTTDGGYTLFSKDNIFYISKCNTSGVWTSDLFSFSSGGGFASTGDIYPTSSAQGLNARFERLFGDDKPAGPYHYTHRTFDVNNFTGHLAGFEDSQSTPYSFGGSPGSFSLVDPGATRYAASDIYRHHLHLQNFGAAGALYVKWSNATGKQTVRTNLAIGPHCTAGDNYAGEIRVWGVQAPAAGDKYYALRWTWNSTRKQLEAGFYYGSGVTFAAGDGTLVGAVWDWVPGALYWTQIVADATPAGYVYTCIAEGTMGAGQSIAPGAGYPTIIKEAWFRIASNTWNTWDIDDIYFYT
jgi:hypothetical protein